MAVVINGNGSITGLDIHDSAATQAQINSTDTHDSVAVQSQFDSAFPSAFDTRFATKDLHDSVAVQAQIDSAAVTLTGDQTIAGIKTFSSTPKSSIAFEAASAFRFTKSTTSGTDNALYYDSDHLYIGRDTPDLRFRTNGGTIAMGIDSAGSIYTGSTGLGDKLSLYDNRLNGTNMYGFGIGGSTLYYKSVGVHDFYLGENYDGASHKVRIDADGIKFHGDTSAANALDDYEQGTWNVTLSDGTTTSGTLSTGYYTKIGQVVIARFDALNNIDPTGFTGGSNVRISLPFTAGSTGRSTGAVITDGIDWGSRTQVNSKVSDNANYAVIVKTGSNLNDVAVNWQDINSVSLVNDIGDFCIVYTV